MKIIAVLFLTLNLHAHTFPLKADPVKTPGDVCTETNPDFKEFRYKEKIAVCNRNITTAKRSKVYDSYGIVVSERKNYTIDHFIPLFIGGSNDIKNLWPQHKDISSAALEYRVYNIINAGKLEKADCLDLLMAIKK